MHVDLMYNFGHSLRQKNPFKAVGYASQKGILSVFTHFRGPKSVETR
jgi:hypothetical protein